LVTAGAHLREWTDDHGRAGPDHRIALLDIAHRRHVAAIFAGHEHLYLRARLRQADGSALWHVTSGGGGSPLHYVSEKQRMDGRGQRLPGGWSVASMPHEQSVFHYCRLV